MLRTRVLTAAAGLPLLLAALWAGGGVYLAVVAALSAAAFAEAARLLTPAPSRESLTLGLTGVAGWILTVGRGRPAEAAVFVSLYLLVLMSRQVLRHPGVRADETAAVFFGSSYAGLTFAHFAAMRRLPDGLLLTLFVFVLTWAFDITAYFVGVAWGRHKMVPNLSPGKSWEGAAGGALATMAVAAAPWSLPIAPWVRLCSGLLVIVAGQFGDLAESSLKRFRGLKDSGGILPGHGGLLDRFDSLMFAVPAAYYLFLWTVPRATGV
ncbi:MAG: phosphatidate cytidylyltransferase [Bacillota bacterium]|nr:phosphatidate cytidylyltransferase [Bacillota bacterium]